MEFAIYGDEQDGASWPRRVTGTMPGAREAFRVADDRDVDRTVVTPPFLDPGGECSSSGTLSSANGVRPVGLPPRLACWSRIRSARAQRSSAGFCLRLPAQPFDRLNYGLRKSPRPRGSARGR